MENIEQIRALHNNEKRRAGELARARVNLMGLPTAIEIPEEINNLSRKIGKTYQKQRNELIQEHGENLPKIVAIALHEYWFACWNSASFFQVSIDDGEFNDNDYTRNLATPEGYAEYEGWAYTLANGFADLVPSPDRIECIKELTGHDILDVSTTLRCMALHWFDQASKEIAEGHTETALGLIHEAHDALALHFSDYTWDSAWKEATKNAEESALHKNPDSKLINIDQEVARRISDKARKAALASHRENHQLKADVFAWCEANRKKDQSRSEAARIISGGLMPIKYPTAYGYITDWDKLHPERVQ